MTAFPVVAVIGLPSIPTNLAIQTIASDAPREKLLEAIRAAEEVWLVDSNNRMGPNDDREWIQLAESAAPTLERTSDGQPAAAHEPNILQIVVDSNDEEQLASIRALVSEVHQSGATGA